MPQIILTTEIQSTIDVCFDLSRSIDLHTISTAHTGEQAIAGKTTGLIELNEFVTWQATHIGIRQKLTSKITAYDRPRYFVDEQIKGPFKSMRHEHYFEQYQNIVVMKDFFNFCSPFGIAGMLVDKLFMTRYLQKLLITRNQVIKEFAETGKWELILGSKPAYYSE